MCWINPSFTHNPQEDWNLQRDELGSASCKGKQLSCPHSAASYVQSWAFQRWHMGISVAYRINIWDH
jgi:hypothetical protein